MKERPILFSAPMVRAILEGRKWQTRRLLKPQPKNLPYKCYCDPYNGNFDHFTFWNKVDKMILDCGGNIKNTAHWKCPYGKPGDRLWVRETFADLRGMGFDHPEKPGMKWDFSYKADCGASSLALANYYGVKWKPSIHMPRKSSRINLEITNVRVEQLQDISEEDAINEGVVLPKHNPPIHGYFNCSGKYRTAFGEFDPHRLEFC